VLNKNQLDRDQLNATAVALTRLMNEAVDKDTSAVNRMFELAGARLGFRVFTSSDGTVALIYEMFGSIFYVKGIDGGVIATGGSKKGSDLERVDKTSVDRVIGKILCRTQSPLSLKDAMPPAEELVPLRDDHGKIVAMITDQERYFFVVASKTEARRRLTAMQEQRGKFSPDGYTRLREAIDACELPPMPQLNTRRMGPIADGSMVEVVLDGDWIVSAKVLK